MQIITYNGLEADASNCRKIQKLWYIIGDIKVKDSGQCYLFEDTYYRETTNKLAWDAEIKQYNLTERMVNGYTEEGGMGWFTANFIENHFNTNENYYIQNDKAVEVNKLNYDFSRGIYTKNELLSRIPRIMGSKPSYRTLATNIYSMADYPVEQVEQTFNNYYKYNPSIFDKFLNGYTYGLEVETDAGWLPENLYYKLGCIPLKDGSIKGTEITTLKYPPHFRLMEDLFDKCNKFTMSTQNNSLHVNLSGFKNSVEFRVALYVLYYRLQQEILQFTPLYKRDLRYLMGKEGGAKDHCKPMESLGIIKRYMEGPTLQKELKDADITIFKFLNQGLLNEESNPKTRVHSKEGGHKWDMHNRYYALNLIPLYFGNIKNMRIEFRLHSGTVNKYKALSWIFICSSIVKFVEKNALRILTSREKITIEDVLFETCIANSNNPLPEETYLFQYLMSYIKFRSAQNTNEIIRGVNDIYQDEFSNDNKFIFEIDNKSIFSFENSTQVRKSSTKRS